jgi:6-phosphogluconate dehydrogenase
MEIGIVGLGRMGGNMAARLVQHGHGVVAYDRSAEAVAAAQRAGATAAGSLADFARALQQRPRVMWVMLPAGAPTTDTLAALAGLGSRGDIVIDGGNTHWKVALQDAAAVQAKGLQYLDAGTSGGIWGLQAGYCLMVGGPKAAFDYCQPLLRDLAPEGGGLVWTGPEGSGHFVKMVHNGIEYGLMQAYAEGFEILKQSHAFPDLDLPAIADAWRSGSVVRSWLLDLIKDGLAEDPGLARITGYVEDTGEGRWTVEAALEEAVPAPIITQSLFARFRSRQQDSFANKMVAMMRHQFGGHAVKTSQG